MSGGPTGPTLDGSADYRAGCCLPWAVIVALVLLLVAAIAVGMWLL